MYPSRLITRPVIYELEKSLLSTNIRQASVTEEIAWSRSNSMAIDRKSRRRSHAWESGNQSRAVEINTIEG
jgi:hypothetical protein